MLLKNKNKLINNTLKKDKSQTFFSTHYKDEILNENNNYTLFGEFILTKSALKKIKFTLEKQINKKAFKNLIKITLGGEKVILYKTIESYFNAIIDTLYTHIEEAIICENKKKGNLYKPFIGKPIRDYLQIHFVTAQGDNRKWYFGFILDKNTLNNEFLKQINSSSDNLLNIKYKTKEDLITRIFYDFFSWIIAPLIYNISFSFREPFDEINIKKLFVIENYHQGLSSNLDLVNTSNLQDYFQIKLLSPFTMTGMNTLNEIIKGEKTITNKKE